MSKNPFLGLGFESPFTSFSRSGGGQLGPLYDFTTFTFTSGLLTAGRTGPTQATFDANATYTSQVWYSSYFSVTDGIQYWTAPSTGSYTIRAAGAAGLSGQNANGNKGIIIESTIDLTRGQQYKILCGRMGGIYINAASYPSAGGGGTFMTTLDNTAVIIAGGGGGGFSSLASSNGQAGTSGASTGFSGGTDGNGGAAYINGGGGGGLLTDGGGNYGGDAFVNGGLGGDGPGSDGGFGGGGGGYVTAGQGNGGGGGYSGGAGSGSLGGGGGSYSQTSITTIGLNQSYGYLIITKI